MEEVEIRAFILPRNFPAVLIISTGRGTPPPHSAGRGGEPPLPRGEGSPRDGAPIPAINKHLKFFLHESKQQETSFYKSTFIGTHHLAKCPPYLPGRLSNLFKRFLLGSHLFSHEPPHCLPKHVLMSWLEQSRHMFTCFLRTDSRKKLSFSWILSK